MKKHIIWSSDIGDINDWRDILEDSTCPDDFELWERATELNEEYLQDELCTLDNIRTDEGFVAFADLGLWDGRRTGYKCITSRCLGEAVLACHGVDSLFIDELNDFCIEYNHHDGTNYITIREWKPGVTKRQVQSLLGKVYNGTATRRDITRYTQSVGPAVIKLYGWR